MKQNRCLYIHIVQETNLDAFIFFSYVYWGILSLSVLKDFIWCNIVNSIWASSHLKPFNMPCSGFCLMNLLQWWSFQINLLETEVIEQNPWSSKYSLEFTLSCLSAPHILKKDVCILFAGLFPQMPVRTVAESGQSQTLADQSRSPYVC